MSTDPNRERVEALAEVLYRARQSRTHPDTVPEVLDAQALLDSPAMRDLLAEAWDEGADVGFDSHAPDDFTDVQARNPYRQETA